jgi:hypothetical protein
MQRQPILLQTCAIASTATESRFRINPPEPARRASRIIALDRRAAKIVEGFAGEDWRGGHFLTYVRSAPGLDAASADATLSVAGKGQVLLSEEVADADVVVMIATADADPAAAEIVGDACAARRVMPAALVVDEDGIDQAIQALRPNAMVLVVLKNVSDIPHMLTALRT